MGLREKRHQQAEASLGRALEKREKILADLARVQGTIAELRKSIRRYERLQQPATTEARTKLLVNRILTKGVDDVFPNLKGLS